MKIGTKFRPGNLYDSSRSKKVLLILIYISGVFRFALKPVDLVVLYVRVVDELYFHVLDA